jgi:hypothetical protein
MAKGKKGIDKSIFVVVFMAVVGLVWAFYTGQSAAPPLPATTMPVVFNAPYDGSVWQIRDWLKKHAKNPASLKVLHWGKVESLDDGFLVHVKFEAKNAAGAEVPGDKVFRLDGSGEIVGMVDFKPK